MTDWSDDTLTAPEADLTAQPAPLVVEPTPEGGEVHLYDFSGDEAVDTLVEFARDGSWVAVTDTDGDQLVDTFGLDANGDGIVDLVVTREGDGYRVQADLNGDGQFDGEQVLTREQLLAIDPTIVQALDFSFAGHGPADPGQPEVIPASPEAPLVVDGQLIGDPQGDAEHWFKQAGDGYCVPASIAQIVSEYTGVHFADEQAFVERANALHVFNIGPDGVPSMTTDGALALLEDAGIPASLESGTGVETLLQYLDEGRRVVVFIDSGEIWTGEPAEDSNADHAVVVTGVDLERQVVIVSDPGHPAGNAAEYPIGLFQNAWEDSGFLALVCDVTPEEFAGTEPAVAEPALAEPQPEPQRQPQPGGPSPLFASVDEPGRGVLPDLLADTDESGTDAAITWAVENRWAVLPIVMGAAFLVGRGARTGR